MRFMDTLRLRRCTLLRGRLAGLSSVAGMLNLLGLLCLLGLLGLDGKYLLRLEGLSMWHLLEMHQIDRSHPRVPLHCRYLGRCQALGAVG